VTALCEDSSPCSLTLKYSVHPKEFTDQEWDNTKWGPATQLAPEAIPAKVGLDERLWDILQQERNLCRSCEKA